MKLKMTVQGSHGMKPSSSAPYLPKGLAYKKDFLGMRHSNQNSSPIDNQILSTSDSQFMLIRRNRQALKYKSLLVNENRLDSESELQRFSSNGYLKKANIVSKSQNNILAAKNPSLTPLMQEKLKMDDTQSLLENNELLLTYNDCKKINNLFDEIYEKNVKINKVRKEYPPLVPKSGQLSPIKGRKAQKPPIGSNDYKLQGRLRPGGMSGDMSSWVGAHLEKSFRDSDKRFLKYD